MELKLNFGVREKMNTQKLLNCLLEGVRFYFKCPYCKNEDEIQVSFKRKKVQRFNEEKQKKETVDKFKFEIQYLSFSYLN